MLCNKVSKVQLNIKATTGLHQADVWFAVQALFIGEMNCVSIVAGVKHLYVHVVQSNQAAKDLYCMRCGFHEEQSESEACAHALGKPARLLLGTVLAE